MVQQKSTIEQLRIGYHLPLLESGELFRTVDVQFVRRGASRSLLFLRLLLPIRLLFDFAISGWFCDLPIDRFGDWLSSFLGLFLVVLILT